VSEIGPDEAGDDLTAAFADAGLYDPDAADAPARLALLSYLASLGISLAEISQADEEGRILSFAAFRQLRSGGRLTFVEAAAAAGVEIDLARRTWRAAGFPEPRRHERRFGDGDLEIFALVGALRALVGEAQALQIVRTMGESTARIAEAEVGFLRSNVEAPLAAQQQWADVARAYVEIAARLLPQVTAAIDTLHRHHLEAVGRRYSDTGSRPSAANVVELAVGFADLSGYTDLAQRLAPSDLGAMLADFETVTGDVIAEAGAHVVKRIGDAVMFVASAPGVACALALDLVDAVSARGLPRLRIGLAFGEVIVRHGDFYGGTVNLAARLVASADAGVVLTHEILARRLARHTDLYVFHPVGHQELAGFDAPVATYQLLRASR